MSILGFLIFNRYIAFMFRSKNRTFVDIEAALVDNKSWLQWLSLVVHQLSNRIRSKQSVVKSRLSLDGS